MKTAVAVADRKALRFPLWHTAALPGLLATLIELSTRMHGASHSEVSHRLTGYLVVATFELAMAAWIIFGCRIQGESVHSLLGDFTARLRAILRDCGLAIGFLVSGPLHPPRRHSNGRLISLENGLVRFRWRDSRHNNRSSTMTLDAVEFIRRFLLHVLPSGFVKIRHFGLLANRNRRRALALVPSSSLRNGRRPRHTARRTATVCAQPILFPVSVRNPVRHRTLFR